MSSSRIWLIRHGETEWSRDGRHTGTTDVPLTTRGEAEADAVRSEIAAVVPGLVLCSPMERARDTAARAGLVPDDIDPDLCEWDYGLWEGRTTSEIRSDIGNPSWLIWDYPVPPGATARVDRVIARCQPVIDAGRDCVLVAHGHVLRILTARWLGQPPIGGRMYALDPARLSALGYEHETMVIRCWNATSAERISP